MSQRYEKLKTLLRELFQLDQPDLDFGLYRVMHAKSAEVSQFLDKDLLPQVQAAFGQYRAADKAELEKELSKVIAGIEAAGMNPDDSPKVKELRAKVESDAVDIGTLESEVYDHLFSFFRRYYSEGDFLAKRVYKPGVYAIPYEGEEVMLHWANKDQYYIKTSEYLRDYAFRLKPGDERDSMRVHFRLADVAEGEHGNVKAADGNDRVFVLVAPGGSGHDFMAEEDGEQGKELIILFEYRPATLTDWSEDEPLAKNKPPVQKDLSALATKRILAATDAALAEWLGELSAPHVMANGETADYCRLEAHLKRYTARNTFDYFIHKDLGAFLRRELDFYIKNEVMHLDDVENESAPRVEQYLSKIKVIRKIAGKIIDFLAQLEDFQKKLWLKKKFVVETQYCIRLSIIPVTFYAEIAANKSQHEEWVKLLALDELKGDLTTPSYTETLKAGFLKAHPTLVVDTRHFGVNFKARLLDAIGDVDEQADGVLFQSENLQALATLSTRYRQAVAVLFADPPYNTGVDGFPYKDTYQHSSWLSMIEDRLGRARSLLSEIGLIFLTIDYVEVSRLRLICDGVFGAENFLADTAWEKRYTRSNNAKRFYSLKDTVLSYRVSETLNVIREARTDKSKSNYSNPDNDPRGPWISSSYVNPATKERRANLVYPIHNPIRFEDVEHPTHAWKYDPETHRQQIDDNRLYWGLDGNYEYPRLKSFLSEASEGMVPVDVWHYKLTGTTDDGGNVVKSLFGSTVFDNPKPPSLVERALSLSPVSNDSLLALDHFAGSGTTGHAVINLNREDGGRRKFILVEMGDYFDTVLLPRIKKVTFSPEWKGGKPQRSATDDEANRGPRIVKVVRLESYEDALNNLETRRTDGQKDLLDSVEAQGADGFKEQYMLRYMLDVETRGSQSLLNVQAFSDPTAYKLKVKRPGSDESREVNVDLLETFNWLIGLTVRHIAAPQTFNAVFMRDSEKRLRLKRRLRQEEDGPYWFRTVTGTTPDSRRTLVIWRKLIGESEQDNLVLDEWFSRQGYSAKDSEFDLIYVNGGNNLENLKTPDDLWKVRLIEEDFHRLMFDVEGA